MKLLRAYGLILPLEFDTVSQSSDPPDPYRSWAISLPVHL